MEIKPGWFLIVGWCGFDTQTTIYCPKNLGEIYLSIFATICQFVASTLSLWNSNKGITTVSFLPTVESRRDLDFIYLHLVSLGIMRFSAHCFAQHG